MFEPPSWKQLPSWQTLNMLHGLWRAHPRYRGCTGHYLNHPIGGRRILDISGRAIHGTFSATAGVGNVWITTPSGIELRYDRNFDTHMNFPAVAHHAPTNLSVSFWTSHQSSNSIWVGPVGKTNTNIWSQGWGNYFNPTALQYYHFVGAWSANRVLTGTFSTSARVHHAMTWNDGAGLLAGYLNGAGKVTQSSTPGTYSATVGNTTNPLYIGTSGDPGEYASSGIVSDVRIYNRALSDAEIYSLYIDPYLEFKWAWDVLYERFTFGTDQPVVPGAVIRARALLGLGR